MILQTPDFIHLARKVITITFILYFLEIWKVILVKYLLSGKKNC